MIEQIKAMKLEDMAETARAIVEDGHDEDNTHEPAAQQRVQPSLPHKKNLRMAKMNGFKKELTNLYDNC